MRVLAFALCLGLASAYPTIDAYGPGTEIGSQDINIATMHDLLGEGFNGISADSAGSFFSSSSSSSSSSQSESSSSKTSYFVSHGEDDIIEITVEQAGEYGLECVPASDLTESARVIVEESVDEEVEAVAGEGDGTASSSAGEGAAAASAGGVASSASASGGAAASSAASEGAAASAAATEGAAASSAAAGGAASSAAASEGAAASSAASEGAAASAAATEGAAASSAAAGGAAASSATAGGAASSAAASEGAAASSAASEGAAASSAASEGAAASSAASEGAAASAAAGGAAASSAAAGGSAASSAAAGGAASSAAASEGAAASSAASEGAAASSAASEGAAASSAASEGAAASAAAGGAAASSAAAGGAAASSAAAGGAASSAAASEGAAASSAASEGAAASSAASEGAAASSAASEGAAASSAASEGAAASAAAGGAAASSAAAGGAAASSAAAGGVASSAAASEGAAASSAVSEGAAASSAASEGAAASSAAAAGAAASSAAAGGAAASAAAGESASVSVSTGGSASATSTSSSSEEDSDESAGRESIQVYGDDGYGDGASEKLEQDCVCVPYYLCKEDNVITDGAGLIDIRFNSGSHEGEEYKSSAECPGFIDVCCTVPEDKPLDDLEDLEDLEYEPQCGKRNPDGVQIQLDGFNDGESQFGEFPWMAIILEDEQVDEDHTVQRYVCGGSLIHPQVILTGAHCVHRKRAEKLRVRLGDWDTKHEKEFYPHEEFRVASKVQHRRFNSKTLFNDFALLFLEQPVELKPHIDTICLPDQRSFAEIDTKNCVATGFGKDRFHGGRYQNVMKQVDLSMVDRPECQKRLRTTKLGRFFKLHRSFACAGGDEGVDTCRGDGGSPLVCPRLDDPEKYVQAGIVAWGIGCGEGGIPGVYASVPMMVSWINEQIASHFGQTVDHGTQLYGSPPI